MNKVTMKLGAVRKLSAEEERELASHRPEIGPPAGRRLRSAWRREALASPAWRAWLASPQRRALIECNIPWAMKVAATCGGLRLGDDRFGVAMVALCNAADGFDPDRGRMTTYVQRSVVLNVRRAEMDDGYTVRVPEYVQEYVRALDRGETPRVRRASMEAMVPFARAALAGGRRDPAAFEAGGDDGDDDDDLAGVRERLRAAVGRLPDRLADVVRARHFPESGARAPTYAEVGRQHGVCKERARQLLNEAYQRLREEMAGAGEGRGRSTS